MEDNNHSGNPYVYVGQINMFNKTEAGAELAAFINKVMSSFYHKEGIFTGFVKAGQIQHDNNYNERLKRIGFEVVYIGHMYPQKHTHAHTCIHAEGTEVLTTDLSNLKQRNYANF